MHMGQVTILFLKFSRPTFNLGAIYIYIYGHDLKPYFYWLKEYAQKLTSQTYTKLFHVKI